MIKFYITVAEYNVKNGDCDKKQDIVFLHEFDTWFNRLRNHAYELQPTHTVDWNVSQVHIEDLATIAAIMRNEIYIPEMLQGSVDRAMAKSLPYLFAQWVRTNRGVGFNSSKKVDA
jgi:hypothetical protein